MEVRGKVALITGSARGLGRGYAEALLKRGAKVFLTDVIEEAGRSTEAEFKTQYGADHVAFSCGDVTKQTDMERVFESAVSEFGTLDIVINNAGIGGNCPLQLTFDINVFGVIRCSELALERMHQDKGGPGGVIINIASVSGLYNHNACPNYFAAKHAVVGYTGNLGKRLEAQQSGIRMVALCPGPVKTDLTKPSQILEDEGDERMKSVIQGFGGWTPMSTVVDTCMRLIESEVPAGSIVRVDNDVVGIAERDQLPFSPLP